MPEKSPESGQAGAPSREIEITPEMIDAGVDLLAQYDPDADTYSETVIEIFSEMNRVRLGSPPPAR